MIDFFYRTEEIKVDEVKNYFVETKQDRIIIEQLKARNPVLLVGSRGVGKSFLFRVAEAELLAEIHALKTLPVYVTFRKSSLIHTTNSSQFQYWMLARICHEVLRTLSKNGVMAVLPASLSILAGETIKVGLTKKTKIEQIADSFEESWQDPGKAIDTKGLPTIDSFLDAIEDVCVNTGINRIVVFIDEAAHIFVPEQQRQFFTLFRDLRSPYITCNAAVYPGVTSYGDTFQPIHDASVVLLNRDFQDDSYVKHMKEIVLKQLDDSSLIKNIARRGENFAILAYAASGNPRNLLKTVSRTPKMDSESINKIIREYYRTEIWAEHSGLSDKYPGHRVLVDWGRKFIEGEVLPELQNKNNQYLADDKKTTCFFWMHRDIPQPVKEALRLLEYTGIVTLHSTGIKATRSEIGIRYAVNFGCIMAQEAAPASVGLAIANNVTPKRMSEYGSNHKSFESLMSEVPNFSEPNMSTTLSMLLAQDIAVLDLTPWQMERLRLLNLHTVGNVLTATELMLQQVQYVGEKRARLIRNAAIAAVYEYLSG
ncbi:MAG: hypothetical protein K0S61_3068 [Anaerocolumna sp.]|nr:hypothetical protein [Anaerocolumna sp.]